MNNIKKRVVVIVSGLAFALIMGAVSDGPEYSTQASANPTELPIEWLLAADVEDDTGGG